MHDVFRVCVFCTLTKAAVSVITVALVSRFIIVLITISAPETSNEQLSLRERLGNRTHSSSLGRLMLGTFSTKIL